MTKQTHADFSDDELWQQLQQVQPEPQQEAEIDPDLLCGYVDGMLDEKETQECEQHLANHPTSFETFILLREMALLDEEESNSLSKPTNNQGSAREEARISADPVVELSTSQKTPTANRFSLYATAIAASLLALAFGFSFNRSRGLQTQLASVRSDLTQQKLRELQTKVDLLASDSDTPVWLGNPTEFYGLSSARMRGGSGDAPDGKQLDLESAFTDLPSVERFDVPQKIWLAELQIGSGKLDAANATLLLVPESQRNEAWIMANALKAIATLQAKQSTWDQATADQASEELNNLLESQSLRPKALFNLASLRLLEGKQLRETDFPASRERFGQCIAYANQLLESDAPAAMIEAAQDLKSDALARQTP